MLFIYIRLGDYAPYCIVMFSDQASRDKCATALNRRKWKDRELFCGVVKGFRFPTLKVENLHEASCGRDTMTEFENLIGEKCIRAIGFGAPNRRG